MSQISGVIVFDFRVQGDTGHVLEVRFLLDKSPNQNANEDGAKQAERGDTVILDPAEMSENVLDHKTTG